MLISADRSSRHHTEFGIASCPRTSIILAAEHRIHFNSPSSKLLVVILVIMQLDMQLDLDHYSQHRVREEAMGSFRYGSSLLSAMVVTGTFWLAPHCRRVQRPCRAIFCPPYCLVQRCLVPRNVATPHCFFPYGTAITPVGTI